MKTSELIGRALDCAVELARGTHWSDNGYFVFKNPNGTDRAYGRNPEWQYSTDWSQGGSIIEREKITISFSHDEIEWQADVIEPHGIEFITASGQTPLIAAMRCFVASKLGDKVDIPKEQI